MIGRVLPPLPRTARPTLGAGRHLVERNALFFRGHVLVILGGFFEALFYLLSIGIGVSDLVGDVEGPGGKTLEYTEFVAPAMLAASAMNGAVMESFNIMAKLHLSKAYEAVLATPITIRDIAVGEITWSLMRGGAYSAAFLAVMASLGLVSSWWAVLALPAALLVGFTFAALGLAAVSVIRGWQDFEWVMTAVLPMFLFSGTFAPLSTYPDPVAWLARAMPLYHGVSLLRGLTTGAVSGVLLVHLLYLVLLGVAAFWVATRRLEANLLT
ncbi:ABC transporter permease [Sporichthya sp.]|uniref:ABC transporter permease n=1 Tax=Sporichthya sp. TaxID=65475 RepID=UPI0017F6D4F9|nr:ABC transporter permease [Sporichthya sp.]MBA3742432.1 ABC transporter permease [Sporichthya sp.]